MISPPARRPLPFESFGFIKTSVEDLPLALGRDATGEVMSNRQFARNCFVVELIR
jgi:hypothetical protein